MSELQFPEISKNLSSQDFLAIGIHKMAYVRPIRVDNKTAYAIHAADGTPLSVLDTFDQAIFVIQDNDLEAASVH